MKREPKYSNGHIEELKRQVDQLTEDVNKFVVKVEKLIEHVNKKKIINCDHDFIDVGDDEHYDSVCTKCGENNKPKTSINYDLSF